MLLAPGAVLSPSLGNPQHRGLSLVISEDPGAASQIVLDLCTVAEGSPPWLHSNGPRRLVGSLAKCSRALRLKWLEGEFPNAIDVVRAVSFVDMHDIFRLLSNMAPLGLALSTLELCEHQDIHLGGIFDTFGLVCEACYVYHPYNDLWLVPMRRILDLMFHVATPFLYYSVDVLDCHFDSASRQSAPQFDCPWGRGS